MLLIKSAQRNMHSRYPSEEFNRLQDSERQRAGVGKHRSWLCGPTCVAWNRIVFRGSADRRRGLEGLLLSALSWLRAGLTGGVDLAAIGFTPGGGGIRTVGLAGDFGSRREAWLCG
jgi:hypothetical protein